MATLASITSAPAFRALGRKSDLKLRYLLREIDKVDSVADAAEVRQYLQLIRANLGTLLSGPQELAIRDIVDAGEFIDRGTNLAFVNMNRLVIGAQLIARVIDYNRIQQRGHSLCGPVTLMHDFARREPVGYVRYVIGLAEDRRGHMQLLGGNPNVVKVKRRSNILTYSVRRAGGNIHIVEADYIALASVRESASLLPYRAPLTSTMLQGATTVSEMKNWMEEMGYSNVADHTLSNTWTVAASAANLHPKIANELQAKFANHITGALNELHSLHPRVIFLNAAEKLAQHQVYAGVVSTGPKAAAKTFFGSHWMLCRDIESSPAQGVRFALDSWGWSSRIGGRNPWLPWNKVIRWYRGYISGTP